jgi:hypothetical protein
VRPGRRGHTTPSQVDPPVDDSDRLFDVIWTFDPT